MSYKVQKFIERKKREDQVKRSLEQTIEVEKQQKIQQNLKNLDRFVQKHLRQKSQPTIGTKKPSIVQGILQGGGNVGMKPKKTHKKNKPTADQPPIVGLSEIFYPNYTQHTHQVDNDFSAVLEDEQGPDAAAVLI